MTAFSLSYRRNKNKTKEKNFYRLQSSLSLRQLPQDSRIWQRVLLSYTAGCPVDVRGGILRGTKEDSPRAAAGVKEFRAQARPQPSKTTALCPTSSRICAKNHGCRSPKTRSDEVACLRTVEVGPEHETPPHLPPEAGVQLSRSSRVPRTSTGRPSVRESKISCHIRANRRGRSENRNRYKFSH
jgi:hypothetical protein